MVMIMIRITILMILTLMTTGCINEEDYNSIHPYLTMHCKSIGAEYNEKELRIDSEELVEVTLYFKCFSEDEITQWFVYYTKQTNTFGTIRPYEVENE